MIRHGEPDYRYCDERGYIGQGRDLAPLSEKGIQQVNITASDKRLKSAEIIISSPYTRALQTAAIISKQTGLDIEVEVDLHEWIPDKTFQLSNVEEAMELCKDFNNHKGIYPNGETKRWEDLDTLKMRVASVLDKYLCYDRVIVVCHRTVMKSIKYIENIAPAEIVELNYEKGQPIEEYFFD